MEKTLITYNVNGIRAAMKKGFAEWLKNEQFDFVCIQETKAQPEQIDSAVFKYLGYHYHWYSAIKKGYSGVGILSKQKPDFVERGIGIDEFDHEGRVIRADFGDISILSTYFPSGSSGDIRQAVKMRFLDAYYDFLQKLKQTRPKLIVCGDYNICHKPIDIHDPVSNKDSSGFLPEERQWMDRFFESGFIDSFRVFHSEAHQYSWWSFRANARANNKGWRIDYNSVSKPMKNQLLDAAILPEVKHSDHCPVLLKFNQ